MAALTIREVSKTGLTPTFESAAGGGDTVATTEPANGLTFLVVRNGGGGSITVTVDSIQPCSHGFDHDLSVSVPATTGERWIGPLTTSRFGANAAVTYSGVTSVTVMAVRVPVR